MNKQLLQNLPPIKPDPELGEQVRDVLLGLVNTHWHDPGLGDPDRVAQLLIAIIEFVVNVAARSAAPDYMIGGVCKLLRETLPKAIRCHQAGDEA